MIIINIISMILTKLHISCIKPTAHRPTTQTIHTIHILTSAGLTMWGPATGLLRGPAVGACNRPAISLLRGPATGLLRGPATSLLWRPATGLLRGPATGLLRAPVTGLLRGPIPGTLLLLSSFSLKSGVRLDGFMFTLLLHY